MVFSSVRKALTLIPKPKFWNRVCPKMPSQKGSYSFLCILPLFHHEHIRQVPVSVSLGLTEACPALCSGEATALAWPRSFVQLAWHSARWASCCSRPVPRGVPRVCGICCGAAGGRWACAHSGSAVPGLGSAPGLWVCVPGTRQARVPALQPRPPGTTLLGSGWNVAPPSHFLWARLHIFSCVWGQFVAHSVAYRHVFSTHF